MIKNLTNYSLVILGILFFFSNIKILPAQTPSDAIMMKKGELCLALIYDYGSWDQYWEGATLRGNENIGTLTRTSLNPMIAAGITDKIGVLIALPYISTKSSGGQMAGVNGFQDINLAVKAEILNQKLGKGKLALLATGAFATPATNYLSDYMPYSLGLGAPEGTLRGILQYKLDFGLYARVSLAHLWRGLTEVERDYYYNNGSYYTTLMDVPNAWNYNGVVGIWLLDESLKVEANYLAMTSTSGDDVRKYNMGQPTNKMDFGQVGGSAQYYFGESKGLGLLVYYSQMIQGRNMGKFTNLGLGLTYQFKVIK
ncbi:MAG: transporter [Bacteroidia bacterium]|nr:transporter [Bacteroidia bacterium]